MNRLDALAETHDERREPAALAQALERDGYPASNPDGSFSYMDGQPPSEPWHRPHITPGNAEG